MIAGRTKSLAALLSLAFLGGCTVTSPPSDVLVAAAAPDAPASNPMCRISANGDAPPVADLDRGLGGAGQTARSRVAGQPAPGQLADRGIGGTGIQGIGGLGIVGVITGFASICVDGLEVRYDHSASVDIDGVVASAAALRAGQVVIIRADRTADDVRARTISVRSEIAGRVEAVTLGTGMLTIGGQQVIVPQGTWGTPRFGLGDWVTVGGLRRGDGVVVASRLDSAPKGTLLARSQVAHDGAVSRIRGLVLAASAADGVKPHDFVTVSGTYVAKHGQLDAVAPDTLVPDLAGYFGASVDRIVLQAFVRLEDGNVLLDGLKLPAEHDVDTRTGANGIAIVALRRRPDGTYVATHVRFVDMRGLPSQERRAGGAMPEATSQAARIHHVSTLFTRAEGALPARGLVAASGPGGIADVTPAGVTPVDVSPVAVAPAGVIGEPSGAAVFQALPAVTTAVPGLAVVPALATAPR